MVAKITIIAVLTFVACAQVHCGIVGVAPYASSYNAHVINHAVAFPAVAPIAAAPLVAAHPSPFVAAAPSAPLLHAPGIYSNYVI